MSGNRFTGSDEEVAVVLNVGATTAAEVDLGGNYLVAVRTDTALVPTTLSFKTSLTSGNEAKLRDATGTEVSLPVTTSITQMVFSGTNPFISARYIVVQGGTSGGVTTQTTAASTITLLTKAF